MKRLTNVVICPIICASLLYSAISVTAMPSSEDYKGSASNPVGMAPANEEQAKSVPGEILVKFTPLFVKKMTVGRYPAGTAVTGFHSIDALNKKFGVTLMEKVFKGYRKKVDPALPDLSTIYKLRFSENKDVLDVIEEYSVDPNVIYAEPNYIYHTCDMIPDDPDYTQQWALEKIQAPAAWDIETGSPDVTIAIIDTGVDWDHPDLAANIWINPGEDLNGNGVVDPEDFNDVDDDENGYVDDIRGYDFVSVSPGDWHLDPEDDPAPRDNDPMDFAGHGTWVAGIAGAVTDNSIGVAGTAWNCRIMAVRAGFKASEAAGGGGLLQTHDIVAAIQYTADNGADVINMSFGSFDRSGTMKLAIDYAYGLGVVLVGAAGNESTTYMTYPAALENVIAVAATDNSDSRAYFSNYGAWIDVSAPGIDIHSTGFDNTYVTYSGTSASAPFVSGLAALLRSKFSTWTQVEIWNRILTSADYIGDDEMGSGRINAYRALNLSSPLCKITSPVAHNMMRFDTILIQGYAFAPDFTQYRVEYGAGEVPVDWTLIISSTLPVENGTLATWDNSALTGEYAIRLTVEYGANQTLYDQLMVYTDASLQNGWPVPVDRLVSSPTFVDLDGDGDIETVFQTSDVLCVYDSQGQSKPGWPQVIGYKAENSWPSVPAIGDMDNDGDLEIVASFNTIDYQNYGVCAVYAFHHDGSIVNGWPKASPAGQGVGQPVLYDLDGDSLMEVLVAMNDANLYAWHYDGTSVENWPQSTGGGAPCPSVADIDNDGDPEILVGEDGYLHAWHHNGSIVNGWPQSTGYLSSISPALGDIDNDGLMEIVCVDGDNLYVFNHDGTAAPGWPIQPSGMVRAYRHTNPILCNIDGDDELEIAIVLEVDPGIYPSGWLPTYANQLYVFNHDGTSVAGFPYPDPPFTDEWKFYGESFEPSVTDMDGDSQMEVLFSYRRTQILIPNKVLEGITVALHRDGTMVTGFPKKDFGPLYSGTSCTDCPHASGGPSSGVGIGDCDGDGDVEIGLGSALQGEYIWDLPGNYTPNNVQWGTYRHDLQRTGCYAAVPVTMPVATIDSPGQTETVSGTVSINGTVSGPFKEYFLEYGAGKNPDSWDLINTSSSPVVDSVLGVWQTDGLKSDFTIKLTVTNDNDEVVKTQQVYLFANIYQECWPQPIPRGAFTSPVVEDMNGDGNKEIIVCVPAPDFSPPGAINNLIMIWNADGSIYNGVFPYNSSDAPVVGDLDDNGRKEIGISRYCEIYFWHDDGSLVTGWPKNLPCSNNSSLALFDLDGNGDLEIIVARNDSIYVFRYDGGKFDGWPVAINADETSKLAVGDLDGNGNAEIVLVSKKGSTSKMHVWHADGTMMSGWPQSLDDDYYYYRGPVLGDLEGDGNLEIIIAGGGKLNVWHHDGTIVNGWPRSTKSTLGQISLADLDKDGDLEIIQNNYGTITTGPNAGKITIWHHDGTQLYGWPVLVPYIACEPAIGDIDGDGDLEVIAASSGHSGLTVREVYAWHVDGTLVDSWPRYANDSMGMYGPGFTPAISDIDGDGDVEVMIGDADYGSAFQNQAMHVWDLDGAFAPSGMAWPMRRHDPQQTGWYGFENIKPQAITDLSLIQPGDDIILQWSPVTTDTQGNPEQVLHYKVYRSTDPAFVPTNSDLIGTTTDNQFVDTDGALGNYCYVVKALDRFINLSDLSNRVMTALDADFSADKTEVLEGEAIQFTNLTFGGVPPLTYEWDFDNDGNTDSTEENPSYAYEIAGTYTVALTATDSADNADNETKVDYITVHEPPTVNIPLAPGWNLISLPLEPDDPAPDAVFAPISGQYDQVSAYDGCDQADPWKQYVPGGGDNDLTAMDVRYGYWIHATSSVTLTITGTQPTITDIPLCPGRNLIGWPSSQTITLPDALSSIADDYDLVYSYDPADDADPWKQFDPDAPSFANDLTALEPGKGYWVQANTACTLTVVQ